MSLGLSPDIPLVSQQWNAIIAVNYSARKFGITRLHHNVFDAKQLCPELVCAHVATLGPGDSQPDYYPSPSRYTHKVSLDPYRKASAKIFTVFQKFCPKYQKGGLDEVFMDITDIVNQKIMDKYGDDLSKWDRATAEMMDWKRDHPDAGVVFGMAQDGEAASSSKAIFLDDNDDDAIGREVEGLDGIKSDDDSDNDSLHDSDDEQETGKSDNEQIEPRMDVGNEVGADKALEDDFDLDLEQLMDGDFDDSFSYSQSHHPTDPQSLDTFGVTDQSLDQPILPPGSDVNSETHRPTPTSKEKSEEELNREKEAEEERLRQEKEELSPFYGIPEDSFEEAFWSEMQLLIAAEFCNEVRYAVKEELGYTCSAGVANNRLLAKLGSGMNKPFQQTIVLPKHIPDLMHKIKLSNIRNLGGKFGKQVKADYNIERASQLWPVPLRQLQQRYGEQAGLELWQWCRGIDHVGVRKIKSKSMCSHKSFIPALTDMEEIQFWITSMCLELVSRMQEEFQQSERWPRTVSLGFYGGIRAQKDQQQQERKSSFRAPHKGTRSMPLGSRFDYGGVEGIAKKMYGQVEKLIKEAETGQGRPIMPLVLLSITVSNFSAGHESAMGDITKFFSKAPVQPPQRQQPHPVHESFSSADTGEIDGEERGSEQAETAITPTIMAQVRSDQPVRRSDTPNAQARRLFFQPRAGQTPLSQHRHVSQDPYAETFLSSSSSSPAPSTLQQQDPQVRTKSAAMVDEEATTMLLCEQCPSPGQKIPIDEWEQHQDFHFALGLLEDDKKQQQIERIQQQQQQQTQQQQQLNGHGGSSKRGLPPISARGKRKKVPASGAGLSSGSTSSSSTSSSSASSGAAPLAKFFKPSTD
ncbi:DNA-directed DNA polymerase eta rad30 [Dissophora globulifera]|uniref:DNA polymerase eta n=1 Tax=Dissophora globulifera TaxID=979702 RepID=A0A9P6UTX2_9FUNG|nr:DNA-directed DNA polymerase eta rad30 [Dissophora globulifera]